MSNLLLIHASARRDRSITRHLTARFASAWAEHHPGGGMIPRDVGINPPPFIDEEWIAAAFARADGSAPAENGPLAVSEELIAELFRADAVVIGAPMYNFGMPAALKAYLDQIVRIGRTFDMNGDGPWPYRPLIPPKPLVLITSAGAAGYEPGGPAAHLNFLEPHLETVLGFIGFTDISRVHVGSEEHQGEAFQGMLDEAGAKVDALAARMTVNQS